MSNKLDLTSTALEKGIDLAKDFLDKLIFPAVEETGLLMKEKVTYWKFKNQVRILNKAKAFCEKNDINPKTISFKLLVPLLETSALEEDELLQDKWAILLSNLVDSEQNIENHVFPYILGQLSKNEFLIIENVCKKKNTRVCAKEKELKNFLKDQPRLIKECEEEITILENKIQEESKKQGYYSSQYLNLESKKRGLYWELEMIKDGESRIKYAMAEPEEIPESKLKEFEISNLIRLGLVKYIQETFAGSQTLEIPNEKDEDYLKVDFDIDVDYDEKHVLTELGELFIKACSEKKTAPNNI